MALKKCKECGNEVSTAAKSCPKCGAILKKGCLSYLLIGILMFVIFGVIGSFMDKDPKDNSSNKSTPSFNEERESSPPQDEVNPKTKTYKEGDTLSAGYTSYAVW